MTDHGFRSVAIGSIVIDAVDIRTRMDRPDVKELATSRKRIALHPVTVDAITNRLVAGRDRMAADLLNKSAKVQARFVEGTPEELADIEDEENIRRRHGDRDALIARRVQRLKGELPVISTGNSVRQPEEPRKVGRPKGAEGKAREVVAKAAGTSTEAVRSAQKRSKPVPAPAYPAPPIALHGWHPTLAYLEQVRAIQEQIDTADRHGRAMHAALTALEVVKFPAGALQRIKAEVHAATAAVRAMRPRSICKACGGNFCAACSDCGWVAEDWEVSEPGNDSTRAPVVSAEPTVPEKAVVSKGAVVATEDGASRSRNTAAPRKLNIYMPDGTKFTGEGAPSDEEEIPF